MDEAAVGAAIESIENVPFDETEGGVSEFPAEEGEGKENVENEKDVTAADEEAVKQLKEALDKFIVCSPVEIPRFDATFDLYQLPSSYQSTTPAEKKLLEFAENFRKQYIHLYRDRKPLLLAPLNECGIPKFVSTTIRPSKLPFEDLADWRGIAEFVSDYLILSQLEPSTELPRRLISPTTLLRVQRGTSFDYATLLCSLLNGVGYDSYVVSGYATREICIADQSRATCPLLDEKREEFAKETTKALRRYAVRSQKNLNSKFEAMMKQRVVDAELKREADGLIQAELDEEERFKPPPDPLYGMRIHAWVLVLAGKRDIAESFFIEPLTGRPYSINTTSYLGIESVWNHVNYWVNMMDCSSGVQKLSYDLHNCAHWEPFLPVNDPEIMRIQQQGNEQVIDGLEDEDEDFTKPQIALPPSWVLPIVISRHDYEMRCPQGKRCIDYKKVRVEKFASYLLRDGLIMRISIHSDRMYNNLIECREIFKNRVDKLYKKHFDMVTGWLTEYFGQGRLRKLKEHRYKQSASGPENDRFMRFYDEARHDGLVEMQETPTSITQLFRGRDDLLISRSAIFGRRVKKFGPADESPGASQRPIQKMIECFARDMQRPANEDVAQVTYLVAQEKIVITYHIDDGRVTKSTREFIKPPGHAEKGAIIQMQNDTHSTFQVDPNIPDRRQVEVYNMLIEYLGREDKCRAKIREAEQEVHDILNARAQEELRSEVTTSIYDSLRNEDTHKKRLETERQREEEKLRTKEMELDYLAPYLAQIGKGSEPGSLTEAQAKKLREEALVDLKQRLIDIANMIQIRFERETSALQDKQTWYQQNQMTLSKEEEEEYLNFCQEAGFRIRILEIRLRRHKEIAPRKYTALEMKLRSDSRLSHLLN